MKAYIFTDPHIDITKNGDELFVDTALSCINNIIDQAEKNKIEYIICNGDVFHSKEVISSPILPKAKPTFERLKNFKTIFLVGNHDLVKKDGSQDCLINLFDEYIEIVKDPYITKEIDGNNFIFCNYAGNDHISNENLPVVKGKKNVLFGHFDCNGFYVNNGFEMKTASINVNNLRMFDRVFVGHYHRRREHKNITYIGSTHHQGRRDIGNPYGFVELDLKTLDYKFKNYEGYQPPCFYEFDITQIDKIKKVKNSFIRITVNEDNTKKITNAKLIEMKNEIEKTNYNVEYSTKRVIPEIDIEEKTMYDFDASTISNAEGMIDGFIENVETVLDKKKLKELIKGKK